MKERYFSLPVFSLQEAFSSLPETVHSTRTAQSSLPGKFGDSSSLGSPAQCIAKTQANTAPVVWLQHSP